VTSALEARLEVLEARLQALGTLVERQVADTVRVLEGSGDGARPEIIERDALVDRASADLERSVIAVLATQTPVAGDLRLLTGVLRINVRLERMGDLCANIAGIVLAAEAGGLPAPGLAITLVEMGGHARTMVAAAVACAARHDLGLATRLPEMDAPLDRLRERALEELEVALHDPLVRHWALRMVLVVRYLERLGDHSAAIGGEVRHILTGA
jgi:phosphate transport system protein